MAQTSDCTCLLSAADSAKATQPLMLQFEIPFQVLAAPHEARAVFTETQASACAEFREIEGI